MIERQSHTKKMMMSVYITSIYEEDEDDSPSLLVFIQAYVIIIRWRRLLFSISSPGTAPASFDDEQRGRPPKSLR